MAKSMSLYVFRPNLLRTSAFPSNLANKSVSYAYVLTLRTQTLPGCVLLAVAPKLTTLLSAPINNLVAEVMDKS